MREVCYNVIFSPAKGAGGNFTPRNYWLISAMHIKVGYTKFVGILYYDRIVENLRGAGNVLNAKSRSIAVDK